MIGCDLISRESRVRDRRKIVLRITEKGEELVRRLSPTLFGSLSEVFNDFSVDEGQQFITQLKTIEFEVA